MSNVLDLDALIILIAYWLAACALAAVALEVFSWREKAMSEVVYCKPALDCDVYLLRDGGGLRCKLCILHDCDDVPLPDVTAALTHLMSHERAGHQTPFAAFKKLRDELKGDA